MNPNPAVGSAVTINGANPQTRYTVVSINGTNATIKDAQGNQSSQPVANLSAA